MLVLATLTFTACKKKGGYIRTAPSPAITAR